MFTILCDDNTLVIKLNKDMIENAKSAKAICILGMHRSGTSMLTRVLNLTGLSLGSEEGLLEYKDEGNQKGHWENKIVLGINEEILSFFGGTWDRPPVFPKNWESDNRLDSLYERARAFVSKMNDSYNVWGFKDPRTCLTLPFWKRVVPHMVCVIPVRHPANVAQSLYKRNGILQKDGILLWMTYWHSILLHTTAKERIFTIFDNYFFDTKSEVERITKFINAQELQFSVAEKEISEFIDPKLRRNNAGSNLKNIIDVDNIASEDIVNLAVDAFTKKDVEKSELFYLQEKKIANYKEVIQKKDGEIHKKDQRIDQLVQRSEERYNDISKKDKKIKSLYGSKTYKIGNLFFRSIHKPYKLVLFPLNLFNILKEKNFNVSERRPSKNHGYNKYTVVSAVYNMEQYLDDYFESLVNQTLNFKNNIHLILVDDGSTDRSSDIIKEWQKKYPNNILYVTTEHGGPASARNLGLDHVETSWVTFIDSDDFVNRDYFEEIDSFLQKKHNNIGIISCNRIYYYEDTKKYSDTYSLNIFYKKRERIVKSDDMKETVQLAVGSAFLKMTEIQKYDLRFDERIVPKFEDAHFISQYFIHVPQFNVAFLKNAKYFYRKRSAKNSLIDQSTLQLSNYYDLVKFGYLGALKSAAKKRGNVPRIVQKMVLYDVVYQIRFIVQNPLALNFLSKEQVARYKSLLVEIFSYIDVETIYGFNLAHMRFKHRVALLGKFKGKRPSFQIAYLSEYDKNLQQIKVQYYNFFDSEVKLFLNNKPIAPEHVKICNHKFLGDYFVNEAILWVSLKKNGIFQMKIDSSSVKIAFANKKYVNGIAVGKIKRHSFFPCDEKKIPEEWKQKRKKYKKRIYVTKYSDAWMLMDRDSQADDNAEHLYRYIAKNHKDINQFFVLRKNSHDWRRLEADGFKLIPFGSADHEALFIHAKHLVSSHADSYVMNYMPHKYFGDMIKHKYTFLQHGITKDDMSNWFNKKKFHCLITAGLREYNSIVNDGSLYKFTKKEVKLTGFPRHDALLSRKTTSKKTILIMPTWRNNLVGKCIDKGNARYKNSEFSKSKYAIAWKKILNSERIKKIVDLYGYEVIFFPHANIQPYLDELAFPDYIKVLLHSDCNIQDLFQKSSIMITDYSSVAFEMAFLYKETIYYQFDKNEIFSGDHIYQKGYFDYVKDGFGPVHENASGVLDELERYVKTSGTIEAIYLNRMKNFFAFHDTKNSERVFHAIQNS
jgi:CDP-glycerol glycerophosphotransferase (TagB/SpsB family)/GT2 family glycosyltransferase